MHEYDTIDKYGHYRTFVNEEKRTVAVLFTPYHPCKEIPFEGELKYKGIGFEIEGLNDDGVDIPVFTGKAKCLLTDSFDEETGYQIAKERALLKYFEYQKRLEQGYVLLLEKAVYGFRSLISFNEAKISTLSDHISKLGRITQKNSKESTESVKKGLKDINIKKFTITKNSDGTRKIVIDPVLTSKIIKSNQPDIAVKIFTKLKADDICLPYIIYLNPSLSDDEIEEDGRIAIKTAIELIR